VIRLPLGNAQLWLVKAPFGGPKGALVVVTNVAIEPSAGSVLSVVGVILRLACHLGLRGRLGALVWKLLCRLATGRKQYEELQVIRVERSAQERPELHRRALSPAKPRPSAIFSNDHLPAVCWGTTPRASRKAAA